MRGRKLEGEALETARKNCAIMTQKAADLSRGKPKTGLALETTLENIKKAGKKSAEVRLGKELNEEHKNNISKGLTNNPKVIAASQKPRHNARATLSNEQIDEIKNDTRAQKDIAKIFNISTATVSRIKNNKRYFGTIK